MANIEAIKAAIKEEFKKSAPLMEVESVKHEFLDWLAQLRFPACPGAGSWEDCVQAFPSSPEEKEVESGLRIRLAVRLYTAENRYLITVMECLGADARGVYIVTAYVNWKSNEWQAQKTLEESYTGQFVDTLKAKHTIWAQIFRQGELHEALNSCALAILGNELVNEMREEKPVEHAHQVAASFPNEDLG